MLRMFVTDRSSARIERCRSTPVGCVVARTGGGGVTYGMKRYMFVAAIVALSAFSFAGCANQPEATASNTDPTKRTYTQKDLGRTTRTDAASALQAADPSVTTSSGGR